jgi:cell wall-associated NlpC family hydrolase
MRSISCAVALAMATAGCDSTAPSTVAGPNEARRPDERSESRHEAERRSNNEARRPDERSESRHEAERRSNNEAKPTEPATEAAAPVEPRAPRADELARYPWLATDARIRRLDDVFAPPPGFTRVAVAGGSFGDWLRGLPLRAAHTPVMTFDGRVAHTADDPHVAAVSELDVGNRDWQQCSDSVIRLHAEWLWSHDRADDAAYRFTSGEIVTWPKFAGGARARWNDATRKIVWSRARADDSRASYRKYLDLIFLYGGTRSLSKEGTAVARADIAPGDFVVMPGGKGTGHAVLILDVATAADGRRVALIGQGYTPAQDFHVLAPSSASVWFSLDGDEIMTPFWPAFSWDMVRRLPQ